MKKLIAILFLFILCVNIIGYRYIVHLLINKADANLESQIDNFKYDEAELVEMRVDLNMPYQERYTDFERHYGEITIDGKAYTYVMRKIEGNVLILKCIRNNSVDQLRNTSDQLTKANSNQEQNNNSQKQNTAIIKVIKSDYLNNAVVFQKIISRFIEKTYQSSSTEKLPQVSIIPPHQPPRC